MPYPNINLKFWPSIFFVGIAETTENFSAVRHSDHAFRSSKTQPKTIAVSLRN